MKEEMKWKEDSQFKRIPCKKSMTQLKKKKKDMPGERIELDYSEVGPHLVMACLVLEHF